MIDYGLLKSPNKPGVNYPDIFEALKSSDTYQAKLSLGMESKNELSWWMKNLALDKG